jgi:predicted tellurium resistance membrane protein TerC
VMLLASKGISEFVEKYPSVKILALSFLLTVGCVLVAEAFEFHIPKGYIYFAMGFSLVVELLNIKIDQVARERTMAQKTDQIDPMSSI